MHFSFQMKNVGLGYRRDMADYFIDGSISPAFIELAPENWMQMGGQWKRTLDEVAEKYPITCHGLSLSIGSPDDLDFDFLKNLKAFLDRYNVRIYSEHLSYSKCDNAHLYDLLPIPFRKDAVKHIVERINIVQNILERPLVLENVSYYTPVAAEMTESDFISEIVTSSGCQLLLDVNNVYVNAFNHQYHADDFIDALPLDRVAYIHMAGHEKVSDHVIIDTHGEAIIDPVYELFDRTIAKLPAVPVLLERDFNIPSSEELKGELNRLESICSTHWKVQHV